MEGRSQGFFPEGERRPREAQDMSPATFYGSLLALALVLVILITLIDLVS